MDRIERKVKQVHSALDEVRSGKRSELVVGQVMTPAPSCISPNTTALELVRLFHAKQFRHLLVTDSQGKLQGVISDRDVLRCFGPSGPPDRQMLESYTAGQLMSTDLVTIGTMATIPQAVKVMIDQGISSLPVVVDGRLIGIVTNTDLHIVLRLLLEASTLAPAEQMGRAFAAQPVQAT